MCTDHAKRSYTGYIPPPVPPVYDAHSPDHDGIGIKDGSPAPTIFHTHHLGTGKRSCRMSRRK